MEVKRLKKKVDVLKKLHEFCGELELFGIKYWGKSQEELVKHLTIVNALRDISGIIVAANGRILKCKVCQHRLRESMAALRRENVAK